MKRFIPLLLFVCLLMGGCSTESLPLEDSTVPTVTEATPAQPAGTYDPFSTLEEETNGAVKVYPLYLKEVTGIYPVSDGVLVFSNWEEGKTTVTRLVGETLFPEKSFTLNEELSIGSSNLALHGNGFSYYDPEETRTVIIDSALREMRSIDAPEGLLGNPLLSPDRSTLYYCTADSIRALDLESGISRVLKEVSYPQQNISAVLLNNTVLQVNIVDDDSQWRSLYLSTETGQILWEDSGEMVLTSSAAHYYGSFYAGSYSTLVFGTPDGEPRTLIPAQMDAECFFLTESCGAVTLSHTGDSQVILEYYDLDSGLREAALTIPTESDIHAVTEGEYGIVYFLYYDPAYDCQVLCRWDSSLMLTNDTSLYTGTHYTRENPDYDGLAACTVYAQELSEKYGIEILVYKDATAVQPVDYVLTPEYRVPVLQQELEQLDARLGNYPEGFLQTLAQRFDSIQICVVGSLTGSVETGSLDSAAGIQFWQDRTACIALATDLDTEYALYHELCHLIDTIVLNESIAYDQWDKLNPTDFAYDYDYISNANRDGSPYLQGDTRAFIDSYSMSFPKEDRARIMEYAMTEGNAYLFQSKAMQNKLRTLCEGIREAFGLEKSPETFLWEQYLY